jgi:hypothetical protein
MVVQYPHTLHAVSTSSSLDGNGDWTENTHTTVEQPCRAEANSKGDTVKTVDGESANYDWDVFLPSSASDVVPGTHVELRNGETAFSTGIVKRFVRGQFNCRLWL